MTLDSHAVAVDAETGEELWEVKLGEINRGETMTMSPVVIDGTVIVGNSGGQLGVRGWIQALDAASGETLWKAYNTGPDADMLTRPRSSMVSEVTASPNRYFSALTIAPRTVCDCQPMAATISGMVAHSRPPAPARGSPGRRRARCRGRPERDRSRPA